MIILGALGVLAALEAGVAPAAVAVESDSQCPSANAVREALKALGSGNAPRPAQASVRSRDDQLTVELSWPEDPQAEARTLTVEADCESRAQSAAVVIAAWLGSLPAATLVSSPLGIARPFEPGPPVANRVPADQRAWRSWLGVGLGGLAGGGVVPGLRVELLRARTSSGFDPGWMASALVSMPRSKSLDGGTSSWVRPAIGLAGVASWASARIRLAMDLGPLAGFTVAWGRDYPTDQTDASPTWGMTGGLRLQLAVGSSELWGELRVIDWRHGESLQHEIQPTGIVGSVDLPSLEGLVSLGWSFAI